MPGMRRGLGRGLEALLPGASAKEDAIQEIEVDRIRANPNQPRGQFDPETLEQLAESVRSHGILQPIIVRRHGNGYELVAGERRWRAAQLAQLRAVPAVVRELDDREVAEIALIENLQREDLNPLETARAYRKLMDEHGLRQEDIAARVGKSRSAIANSLRLLTLEDDIQALVEDGTLSEGHARALLAVPAGAPRRAMARKVVDQRLSVRQAEALVKRDDADGGAAEKRPRGAGRAAPSNPDVARLERDLTEALAAPVRIHQGRTRGTVEVAFFGDEDLQRIAARLLGEMA